MTESPQMPLPAADPDTQAFWQGCRRHQLLIQRCKRCGKLQFPPQLMCPACQSFEKEHVPAKGRGIVFSYTVAHHPVHPAVRDRVPYNIVLVELEEGVRVVSNLVDCPLDAIRIGMPVELVWEDIADGVSVYKFRPVASQV